MEPNQKIYLPNSIACFVCGEENHAGLKTRFYVEDGSVKAKIEPAPHHCGYVGVVHGGIVAAMIDECMGWAAAHAIERMCVTGELTVRYLLKVPNDRELTVVTEVLKANRRLVLTQGEIVDDEGTRFATAQGKFLPLTAQATLDVDDQLHYRDGDVRLFDNLREETGGG